MVEELVFDEDMEGMEEEVLPIIGATYGTVQAWPLMVVLYVMLGQVNVLEEAEAVVREEKEVVVVVIGMGMTGVLDTEVPNTESLEEL